MASLSPASGVPDSWCSLCLEYVVGHAHILLMPPLNLVVTPVLFTTQLAELKEEGRSETKR